MPFEKLPVIEAAQYCGCLNCGPLRTQLCRDTLIAVGFGSAMLTRDGEVILEEGDSDDFHTVGEAEDLAALDPDHDWRIVLHGPLRGATYQRQAEATWLMVEKNSGFA